MITELHSHIPVEPCVELHLSAKLPTTMIDQVDIEKVDAALAELRAGLLHSLANWQHRG